MQRLLALILLLVLSPLFILIAFLIALTSGLPTIFTQERIGVQQKPFTIFKFRTMGNGEITFFGKILRKTGIDELPQLINIIEGKMSFVGPRPLTKEDIERLGWQTTNHNLRWSVNPGITGLAQLSSVCDASVSWSKDMQYIDQKSIIFDIKIILNSLFIPIIGKKSKT